MKPGLYYDRERTFAQMNHMIDDPHSYFRQFIPERDALLLRLEEEGRQEDIPIVGPLVGQLLNIMVLMSGAKKVLELGTATAYSAIWIARACKENSGHLLSLEHSPELAVRARSNLAEAGLSDCSQVMEGNALEIMSAPDESDEYYDLIFMDIDKEFYSPALPLCKKLLRKGGLLIADNTAFKDADPFNRSIAADPDWKPLNIFSFLPFHSPEKDGICLALRV